MANSRIACLVHFCRENGDSGGIPPASSAGDLEFRVPQAFPIGVAGTPIQIKLPIPIDAVITSAVVAVRGIVAPFDLTTHLGEAQAWTVSGLAAGTIVSNGVVGFDLNTGNTIIIAGAAAALVNVAGAVISVRVTWRRGTNGGVVLDGGPIDDGGRASSTALVGMFTDDADGDNPAVGDITGLFAREERRLAGQRGQVQILRAGVGRFLLPNLTMGYADPWGKVLLTTADIGAGPGQIPVDRTLWQPSQFLNHPQAFVRLGDRVRAIGTARRFSGFDATPLQDPVFSMMRLYNVQRSPVASTWWLIIDGMDHEVTFLHPVGSDFRRPADIWNNIIVPWMVAKSDAGGPDLGTAQAPRVPGTPAAVQSAVTVEPDPGYGAFPFPFAVFPPQRFLNRQYLPRRFGYLSYARILQVWDNRNCYDADNIIVEIPTTPSP